MDNTAFLNMIHLVDESTAEALLGIEKIIEGGTNGLSEIPGEDILEAFSGLYMVISAQREIIKNSVEQNLSFIDELEARIEKLKEKNGS